MLASKARRHPRPALDKQADTKSTVALARPGLRNLTIVAPSSPAKLKLRRQILKARISFLPQAILQTLPRTAKDSPCHHGTADGFKVPSELAARLQLPDPGVCR